jgi:hypothetical protein
MATATAPIALPKRPAGTSVDDADMPSGGTAFLAFAATIAAIVNVFMQGWAPAIEHVVYGLTVLFIFRWAFHVHFSPKAGKQLDADRSDTPDSA